MPKPLKPCKGAFSAETIAELQANLDRDDWKRHKCTVCDLMLMAVPGKHAWQPEPHWPSVPKLVIKRETSKFSRYAPAGAAANKATP